MAPDAGRTERLHAANSVPDDQEQAGVAHASWRHQVSALYLANFFTASHDKLTFSQELQWDIFVIPTAFVKPLDFKNPANFASLNSQ